MTTHTTHIRTILSLLILICACTTGLYAQVKVGNNPTSISATSNLEVEASNGNKTIVDKTGKVTIQDGTQGAGRVFTANASGTGSWVDPVTPAAATVFPFAGALTTVRQTMTASVGGTTQAEIVFQSANINTASAFSTSTGRFTAPTAGYYVLFASTQFDNTLVAGQPPFSGVSLTISKNFGQTGASRIAQAVYTASNTIVSASTSTIVFLNAGEHVSATAGATVSSGSTFQVVASSFYGYKVAN